MAPTMPEHSPSHDHDGRKRVPKACDRCRLKKVKCDGNMPCPRCKMEDAVCHFGARRKSVERPVSAGYVDQLELQQKILIKALKKTWRTRGPTDAPSSVGDDASVHDIVQALGVLDDVPDFRSVSPGFRFRDRLASPSLKVKTELMSPPSTCERRTSDSSIDSDASVMDGVSSFSSESLTSPPSPAQSVASLHTPVTSSSSPSTLNIDAKPSHAPHPETAANGTFRTQRPAFCPLPPRPNFPPAIPSRMDWSTPISFADFQMAPTSGVWLPEDMRWAYDTIAPSFDQGLEGLGQFTDESWNTLVNDSNEYDTLPREFDVWLSLLPNRR